MFFVKLVPLDDNGEVRRGELTWMFEREAFMYSDMLLKFNGTKVEKFPSLPLPSN